MECDLDPVRVGLLGLGTVGGGTVNVLTRNTEEITRRVGCGITVTHASAKNLSQERICDTSAIELTADSFAIVNNDEIDVVVELIGGDTLAKDLVIAAINNGKHVVTANKALIALHGTEIFSLAQEKGVMVLFEAAVAGGIPIIKAIREGLSANKIEWLAGIINGTGNFILTEMRDKGRDFTDVLAEAQALGYAEADPTFDVEGIDAGHKLTILASIAFGIPLQFDRLYHEGITEISQEDVQYAEELGYRIKHLGIARKTNAGIELRVHPALIPDKRLLANVDGVLNAVVVQGDAVGPTLYYGPGAGAEPTASAVVADLIDVVRNINCEPQHLIPHLSFQSSSLSQDPILSIDSIEVPYYLRITVADSLGVLADITNILSSQGINIEALIQKEPRQEGAAVDIIIITSKALERKLNHSILEIENLDTVIGKVNRIRLETLG